MFLCSVRSKRLLSACELFISRRCSLLHWQNTHTYIHAVVTLCRLLGPSLLFKFSYLLKLVGSARTDSTNPTQLYLRGQPFYENWACVFTQRAVVSLII